MSDKVPEDHGTLNPTKPRYGTNDDHTDADPIYAVKARVLNAGIQEIGMGKYQWQLFVVIGFGWAQDNLWHVVTSLILPAIAAEFLVSRPPLLTLAQNIGLQAGAILVGICLMAPQFVIMRYIGERAITAQVKIASYLAVSIASPILIMLTKNPIHITAEPHVWQLMGILTVVDMMANLGIAYAGQRASTTTVTICMYAGVIFATPLQWLLYGNHPSPTAFVGIVIVIMAVLYGVLYGPSEVLEDPEDGELQALLPDTIDRDEEKRSANGQ